MDFNACYDKYLKAINSRIDTYFSTKDIPQKKVLEAMRYAVTGGGKRIRPVLTLAAAEACGADSADAELVALAVECVHNYSLIHDDLPCMDDDDLRRGRATCHKVYGEDIAVLAGDGLLNSAFEILSDFNSFRKVSEGARLKIISTLATASGIFGMIGGQVVDLECERRTDVSFDELLYLHAHKTGALIRASLQCGCLCADTAESCTFSAALDEYAKNLGLAFQIKDDILDVEGSEELLGKPIGSDEKSGKNTFVSLLGMEKAKKYLEDYTLEAKKVLAPLGEKSEFFCELADFLLGRNY